MPLPQFFLTPLPPPSFRWDHDLQVPPHSLGPTTTDFDASFRQGHGRRRRNLKIRHSGGRRRCHSSISFGRSGRSVQEKTKRFGLSFTPALRAPPRDIRLFGSRQRPTCRVDMRGFVLVTYIFDRRDFSQTYTEASIIQELTPSWSSTMRSKEGLP